MWLDGFMTPPLLANSLRTTQSEALLYWDKIVFSPTLRKFPEMDGLTPFME